MGPMIVGTRLGIGGTGRAPTPPDPEAVARLAAAGAEAVELVVGDSWLAGDQVRAHRVELAAVLAGHGLRVAAFAAHQLRVHNPASHQADVRGRALRAIRATCRLARACGAGIVVVPPGLPERHVPAEATRAAAVQTLAQAARYAADEGVTLAVEAVTPGVLGSPREFLGLLDDAGPATLRACLDLGGLFGAGLPFPENWLLELGGRVALIHATDHAPGPGGGPRVCGAGAVPWGHCLAALHKVGYEGALVVVAPEGSAVGTVERGLRWLREAISRVVPDGAPGDGLGELVPNDPPTPNERSITE